MFKHRIILFSIFMASLLTACSSPAPTPDLILLQVQLFDGTKEWEGLHAIAVKDGKILEIGDEKQMRESAGEETEVIDLEGAFLMPGLIDAHNHPISGAEELEMVQLSGLKTVSEIEKAIKDYQEQNPDLEIIRGRGWELSVFEDGNPSKTLLDEWVKDKPAIMVSWDGHSSWVNSIVLEKSGIDRNTPDPKNGRIEKDRDGNPSGTLREAAMGLVAGLVPEKTKADRYELMQKAIAIMNSFGITGFIEASTDESTLEVIKELHEKGALNARVTTSLGMGYTEPKSVAELVRLRDKFSIPDVNTHSVKIFADGVPEAHTAALLEGYEDRHGDFGILNFKPDELKPIVDALDKEGFQVHVHALGDAAIRYSLDAFEGSNPENRHHICHLQVIHPDDIPRFQQMGVAANFQPFWAQGDDLNLKVIEPIIGKERSKNMYPMRSVLKTGAILVAGSDWPVSTLDPYQAIQVAVTRKQIGLENDPPYKPHESLELQEILTAYTKTNAWLMKNESITGQIKQGYSADFVILDQNLLQIAPENISDSKVLFTYFKGKKVFDYRD